MCVYKAQLHSQVLVRTSLYHSLRLDFWCVFKQKAEVTSYK